MAKQTYKYVYSKESIKTTKESTTKASQWYKNLHEPKLNTYSKLNLPRQHLSTCSHHKIPTATKQFTHNLHMQHRNKCTISI